MKHLFLVTFLFAACSSSTSTSSLPPQPEISAQPAVDPALLASIARDYTSWHRVDEWNHWAPELCRMQPSQARASASDDTSTHGKKLYYLYAKDRAAYMASKEHAQPIGQVIVKESFTPVEITADDMAHELGRAQGGDGGAEYGGKRWRPGEKQGLFVMMKLGSDAASTDEGWLYATTNADGNVVHESGRISSCMGCHDSGTNDRMFGLAK